MAQDESQPIPDFWQDDLLERKADANYLEKYLVNRYQLSPGRDKGFVLAVNADWGVGKTFLLKKWADELRFKKYAAVYFDAWANDFTPEPLVAFIAEIDAALKTAFNEIPVAKACWKDAVEVAKQFWKPAGKILAQAILKKCTGLSPNDINEVLFFQDDDDDLEETEAEREEEKKNTEELKKELAEAFGSVLKEHAAKKKSISAFKEKLGLLISELRKTSSFQLPVFIFVDELDRCRPDYAIELLEGIKHLFGVPGIYFVVGTNLAQLGESTRAVYGPNFDGTQYLKRFFDLEYSLAPPVNEAFAEALFKTAVISPEAKFISELAMNYSDQQNQLASIFAMYARSFQLSLREQQRAMRNIEAVVSGIDKNLPIHAHYLCFLVMLQCKAPQDFEELAQDGARRKTDEANAFDALVKDVEIDDRNINNGKKKITKLREIIKFYASLAQLKKTQIIENSNGKLNIGFDSDVLSYFLRVVVMEPPLSSNGHKSSLATYHERVRRAGQFG